MKKEDIEFLDSINNIENIKLELKKFMASYEIIRIKSKREDIVDNIKEIENVTNVSADEFNEIHTINVANIFSLKLKIYEKGRKKFKLGNFLYVLNGRGDILEIKKILASK